MRVVYSSRYYEQRQREREREIYASTVNIREAICKLKKRKKNTTYCTEKRVKSDGYNNVNVFYIPRFPMYLLLNDNVEILRKIKCAT